MMTNSTHVEFHDIAVKLYTHVDRNAPTFHHDRSHWFKSKFRLIFRGVEDFLLVGDDVTIVLVGGFRLLLNDRSIYQYIDWSSKTSTLAGVELHELNSDDEPVTCWTVSLEELKDVAKERPILDAHEKDTQEGTGNSNDGMPSNSEFEQCGKLHGEQELSDRSRASMLGKYGENPSTSSDSRRARPVVFTFQTTSDNHPQNPSVTREPVRDKNNECDAIEPSEFEWESPDEDRARSAKVGSEDVNAGLEQPVEVVCSGTDSSHSSYTAISHLNVRYLILLGSAVAVGVAILSIWLLGQSPPKSFEEAPLQPEGISILGYLD
ncbi:hypothetical protein KR51_00016220 [Rubidibacter lacunae KORDI 51-2]|uniref:Uncharacterized protein n=1 Tax=Rubidibacter lacunae KORDI 51-2 TaxID=582515 RepID=U5DLL1_9CHRO|nr:hypothetical protein [Rubidibacter lacunae]ERN41772.1 hypothetical protein KR51_00016220 [Rubidibacter lacunae KORDI 51-2]